LTLFIASSFLLTLLGNCVKRFKIKMKSWSNPSLNRGKSQRTPCC
jgi:hypothetical protein